MDIKFITDSMACLDKQYVNIHNIKVMSRTITIGEKVFDEYSMDYRSFYRSIKNEDSSMVAKASSEEDFYTAFRKYVGLGMGIICTLASSKLCDAYKNAVNAKNRIDNEYSSGKIMVIDSMSNGNQHGYLTMVGIDYQKDGYDFDQIVVGMKNAIEKNFLYLCPQISKNATTTMSTPKGLLNMVPIITVENGKSTVFKNVLSRKNGMDTLLTLLDDAVNSNFVKHITVLHVNNEKEAKDMLGKIKNITDVDVSMSATCPVMDCSAGIGTVGLSWNIV